MKVVTVTKDEMYADQMDRVEPKGSQFSPLPSEGRDAESHRGKGGKPPDQTPIFIESFALFRSNVKNPGSLKPHVHLVLDPGACRHNRHVQIRVLRQTL